ncbi:hypothetical protein LCGC14_0570080 [marine sediment metagenome]|uniref:Uncharacterized protein n=1 Tax=marine sediment metagenome TaxID=412755 RepID=A0A0F9U5W2_9ZZZZ
MAKLTIEETFVQEEEEEETPIPKKTIQGGLGSNTAKI